MTEKRKTTTDITTLTRYSPVGIQVSNNSAIFGCVCYVPQPALCHMTHNWTLVEKLLFTQMVSTQATDTPPFLPCAVSEQQSQMYPSALLTGTAWKLMSEQESASGG